MIRVREYQCHEGHISEEFLKDSDAVPPCPVCGAQRTQEDRVVTAPRFQLEGITGDFPGAHMQWERKRNEKQRIQDRKLRDHGDDSWT